MCDLMKAFDRHFNIGDCRISGQLTEYCRWLVGGRKTAEPLVLDSTEKARAESWTSRYEGLLQEATDLAALDELRGGLAFDGLKRRSLSLADEAGFADSQRGDVFARVAQKFDDAQRQARKDGATGNGASANNVWRRFPYLQNKEELARLQEIQKFASWGKDALLALEDKIGQFKKDFPRDLPIMEDAVANGKLLKRLCDNARQMAYKNRDGSHVDAMIADAEIPEWLGKKVRKSFDDVLVSKRRVIDARKFKRRIAPIADCSQRGGKDRQPQEDDKSLLPKLKPVAEVHSVEMGLSGHPNSILSLKPSAKWTIVADETGSLFGGDAFDGSRRKAGRYVFVLIPECANLPALPVAWHAVSESLESILKAADSLKSSGCGVIGIPVRGLYQTNGDLWYSCIETLLDITLRLLPVDGPAEVELNVERRGTADSGENAILQKIMDSAQYHLSLVNPEKARKIALSGKIIAKGGSPYNGYADLVAFSWGCGADTRKVLSSYGWLGPCLVAEDPAVVQVFHRCLELIHLGGELSAEDWNVLVACPQASAVGSLIGAILRAYGEEARKDVKIWNIYLDYVLEHLDSKAIRMSVLGPQILWLKEYEPDSVQLPPRLRLLWLTVQLAASNHQGGVNFGAETHMREFVDLCASLRDEDAPLVCLATLHLAVEKTDSFEFDAARAMLVPWEHEPVAVPGLRCHAQVLSSLGQHAAFLGDNALALDYFSRAMDEFSRLSSDWQRDFDQTCAYAAIAAMDAGSSLLQKLMAQYLYGGEWSVDMMVDMAGQFATVGEDEPDSKYGHAILLRYLVTLPPEDPIRAAYVSRSTEWKWCEDGHPWELIAFYRAILFECGTRQRREWFKRAYAIASNGGPTLKAIASVISAGLFAERGIDEFEYLSGVDEVCSLLPAMGAERMAALRGQAVTPVPPLELASKVLPFNFR